MSRLTQVEVLPLVARGNAGWDTGGGEDTLVVRITDDDGRAGIGECDAPASVAAAFLNMPTAHMWSRNLVAELIGQDPLELTGLWERLYQATCYPGRRGLGIHVLSAIDIALHDLAAKQVDRPVYKLMGGARREFLTPYATIFPGMPGGRPIGDVMQEIERLFRRALDLGFRAVKMEVLFEDLVNDRELVELIREGRQMLGPDIAMMLDFGYRWQDWRDAARVLERLADCDIFFAEAPLHFDDLTGHAKLSGRSPIRICGAEFAATRFEILEWIERGKVDVVQPDINRCGGLTEIRRIADLAALHGVTVIPHGWKTGITAACGMHYQAATANAPYFEYLSQNLFDSPLRSELVDFELTVREGRVELPTRPGLGIELNEEALQRFRK